MVSNQGVLSGRRQFFKLLFFPAIACGDSRSRQPIAKSVKPKSPLPGVQQPEFWFNDSVKFDWIDENTGESHFESGKVSGIVWNSSKAWWEYQVIWLTSTAYPAEDYPNTDDSLWAADILRSATL